MGVTRATSRADKDYIGTTDIAPPSSAPAPTLRPPVLTIRDLLACCVCVVLAAIVYLNVLHNPFVYDDHRLILENTSLRHLSDLRAIAWHEVTRPLVNLTYAIDFTVWGQSPFGFHVTNVVLHLLNVTLVYLLAWRVTDDRRRRGPEGVDQPRPGVVAFSAAFLFAVHPMMTEAVGYVAGRAEVLCATFFLIAVLTMRRWMIGGRVLWLVASILSWMLALLSKEMAVMFPLVVLAYDRLVCPGTKADRRRRVLRLHFPFYVVGVLAAFVRLVVFASVENNGGVGFVWAYILAEIDVVRRYALLLLMVEPNSQTVFHAVPLVGHIFTWSGLLALGTLAGFIWLIFALYRVRRASASFGILWFLLLLVPSSALVVFNRGEPMAEHRIYLASVGFFLAMSVGIGWLSVRFSPSRPARRAVFRGVMALGAISLVGHTVLRNSIWSSPVRLWADAVEKAPNHWYPAMLLGESLHDAGQHARAVDLFRRSIELRPSEPEAYGKAGICLIELGRLDEAQGMFESLETLDPTSADASNGLGTVALARGQLDVARRHYLKTLQNSPLNVPARIGLAAVAERAGQPAQALVRCQEIQELAPDTPGNDDCLRRNGNRAAGRPGGG